MPHHALIKTLPKDLVKFVVVPRSKPSHLLLVVSDLDEFHRQNCLLNKNDYGYLWRLSLKRPNSYFRLLPRFNDSFAKVFYNVTKRDTEHQKATPITYGVVSYYNALKDLE